MGCNYLILSFFCRLEQIVFLQKNELLHREAKLKNSPSLSNGSNRSIKWASETKVGNLHFLNLYMLVNFKPFGFTSTVENHLF